MEKLVNAQYKHYLFLTILLLGAVFQSFSQGYGSEEELKKKAEELFQEGAYIESTPLFSQLVSLYPGDPMYNYKYGACLIYSDVDKSKSLKYLKFAIAKPGVDKQAFYFYGKALHLNYEFDQAVKYYTKFNEQASSKEKKEFEVEHLIEMCGNGKSLLQQPNEISVLGKQTIKRSDFFRAYNLGDIGGKIIVKPDQFKTKYDLKVNEYSIIHLQDNPSILYYSSYGENKERGKDIFRMRKLENGEWGAPENIGTPVNTPFDEDYPFMHGDGKTLYFSSKGHNSMGGYDVFRSTYNEATGTWSEPINMDFAISSADDDILFISSKDNQIAYFASARYSLENSIDVYKVLISKRPIELSLIKGKFIAESSPDLKKAKIAVVDPENGKEYGVFNTDEATGDYVIKIPKRGGTYKFILETTDDAPIHSGKVDIPSMKGLRALKQELRLVGEGDKQKLVIKNLFDEENSELVDPQYITDLLRQKAQLNVNTEEADVAALLKDRQDPSLVRKENAGSTNAGNDYSDMSNEELLNDLQVELNNIQKNIQVLQAQTKYGFAYTNTIAIEADDLYSANEDILDEMSGSGDEELEKKLKENKKKANPLATEAIAGYGLSGSLENEVKEKKQEMRNLNESMGLLRSKINANNREEALAIYSTSKQKIKTLEETGTTFETEPARLRERSKKSREEAIKSTNYLNELRQEQKDLEQEIERNKKELTTLKGKKKEAMQNQINIFELDLEDIGFEASNMEKKAKKLQDKATLQEKELSMTTQLIEKINQNNETASALSPEEKVRLEDMISFFKEQNLLDDILGEEEASLAIINNSKQVQGSENYHPAFDEDGKPVDYDAIYEAEKAAVEKEPDLAKRLEALSEIYDHWAKTISEDLKRKEEQLKSAETEEQRKALEEEISALNEVRLDKEDQFANNTSQLAAIKNNEVATTNPTEGNELNDQKVEAVTVQIDDQSLEEGIALSPVNASGAFVDYGAAYQEKLTEVSQLSDESSRQEKTTTLNKMWVETIQADLSLKQNSLDNEKDEGKKEALQLSINTLKEEEKERLSVLGEAEGTTLAQLESSPTNSENNAPNSVDNESPQFSKLKDEPAAITDENGAIIAYPDYYEKEFKQALTDNDEAKQATLNENWSTSTNAEIALRKQQLTSTTDEQEKDKLYSLLASLQLTEEKRKASIEAGQLPTVDQQMTTFSKLSEDPESIVSDGAVIEYDSYYEQLLALAKEEGDEARENSINEQWSISRSAHIKILKAQVEASDNEEANAQILALIAALEAMNAEGKTSIAGTAAVEEEGAEVAYPLVSAMDENGNTVDYNAVYQQQQDQAIFKKDAYEKATALATINKNWATTINEDVTNKEQQLAKTRKKKEKQALSDEIDVLKKSAAQKKSQEAEQSELATSLDPVEVKRKNTALFAHEKLAIQYEMLNYQDEDSELALAEAGKLIIQVVELEEEIARKQALLNTITDEGEREKIMEVIKSLEEQSGVLQLDIAAAFSTANGNEFNRQQTRLNQAIENGDNKNKAEADSLRLLSQQNFNEAQKLRNSAAESGGFDVQKDKLKQAYELELEALRLQRQALVLYSEGQEELAETTTQQETGAVAENVTTKETEPTALNAENINPEATNEEKTNQEVASLQKTTPLFSEDSPLVISQEQADRIEQEEAYQQFVAIQETADRMMKEAEVEYAKSADYQTEADNQRTLAEEKRTAAASIKKKKEKKRVLAEAIQLEESANANQARADSIKAVAEQVENDAIAKGNGGKEYLLAQGDEALFNRLLAYYQAKLDGYLRIQEEATTFTSTEEETASLTATNPDEGTIGNGAETSTDGLLDNLPSAEEISVEEFRKLNFAAIQEAVERDVFVKVKENNVSAYNTSKPIPIDEVKLPEGVIYKVQIGAFRNPIPQDLFKGFAPVNGERTGSGITRYTAGIFRAFESADKAKQEIRDLGYRDAFVVAFRNGKRISISEAKGAQQTVADGNGELAGLTVTPGTASNDNTGSSANGNNETTNTETANSNITTEAPDVTQITGLFYTVQVGVYSNTRIPDQLAAIRPLNSERTSRDKIRYTSGVFDTFDEAATWRGKLVEEGIADAFVTAYLDGIRVTMSKARSYVPE